MPADPKVDYAFKKVFGSESTRDLLEDLVNAVLELPPAYRIVDLQVRNPFNEKETAEDKLSVLDIKAQDASGRLINIEMQMVVPHLFRQRSVYYWAKVYTQQLEEGSDYGDLHPTISICFLNGQLFPKRSEYHHRFILTDLATGEVLTDHLVMHFVELPKFTLTAEQLKTPLEVWCYFLRHGESLDPSNLPATLDVPLIHRALEILNMLTQSDPERERYEARLKGLRDLSVSLAGERQEGRKEGIDVGELIGRIRLAQKMLKQPEMRREELVKLSQEELARLVEHLEKQLFPAGA
jgi:predicted transposase/invertase (TIGR01784 family)